MAVKRSRFNTLSSWPNPTSGQFPDPIAIDRDPTVYDQGAIGQIWVNTSSQTAFVNAGVVAGQNIWTTNPSAGTTFASLTVDPGDLTVTAGNIDVLVGDVTAAGVGTFGTLAAGNSVITGTLDVTSDMTIGGNLDVTGDVTVSGDFDITSAAALSFTTTSNTDPAIIFTANGGAAEAIILRSLQGTAADSIELSSVAGGVTISGGLATADAINIVSSNAAGGIDIDAGTGGIAIDSTGAFSIDGAAASNITTTGAGIDLTLSSALGSVLVRSTEDAALAIRLHANGGTSETIQIHSDQGTGVGSVNLLSDVGGITFRATGLASADAINLEAVAGGIDADAALQINVASSQAAADAIRIIASDAAGGIDVDAGTGGMNFTTANGVIDVVSGTGAISISADAAATTVNIGTGAAVVKTISIGGTGANVIAIANTQTAGSISIGAAMTTGTINIGGTGLQTGTINLAPGTGAQIVTLANGGVGVKTVSIATAAVANVVTIGSTAASASTTLQAGSGTTGLSLSAAGNVQMAPALVSNAAYTATLNARVGQVTLTGQVLASGATQDLVITNSVITGTTQSVFVSVDNLGANDAQLQVQRVLLAANTLTVKVKNQGAAALNGDIHVNFWVIN